MGQRKTGKKKKRYISRLGDVMLWVYWCLQLSLQLIAKMNANMCLNEENVITLLIYL